MSHRYTWPVQVRHYELSRAGQARPEVYLNWMQEAGVMASAHAGYPLERYAAMGAFWWVRRFLIEWHGSVRYGDTLGVTTWISAFRRVRAHREYEVRRSADGSLVLSAQADWPFVDLATGQLIRFPEDMATSFPPDGISAIRPFTWPADSASDGKDVFASPRLVQYHELDTMGHVNHAAYLVWLLENLKECADALGVGTGLTVAPERLDIEYIRPARESDRLVVTCRLLSGDSPRATYAHEIRPCDEDAVLVRARSLCRWSGPAGSPPPDALFRLTAQGPQDNPCPR